MDGFNTITLKLKEMYQMITLGGDAELAGDIVVSTSALCIVPMFAWSVLFKALGAF